MSCLSHFSSRLTSIEMDAGYCRKRCSRRLFYARSTHFGSTHLGYIILTVAVRMLAVLAVPTHTMSYCRKLRSRGIGVACKDVESIPARSWSAQVALGPHMWR